MTAVDRAGLAELLRIHAYRGHQLVKHPTHVGPEADAMCRCGMNLGRVSHPDRPAAMLHREHVADVLLSSGVLPEAGVTEEHGCALQDGRVLGPIDGWSGYRRNELRATHRRTRTRYADHVTEWEAVDE